MKKNKGQFDKGKNNIRGRSKRTLILESIREHAYFSLPEDSTPEQAEKAFFSELLKRAVDPDDGASSTCLRLLTERGWSALKPTNDLVEFEFRKDGTAVDKVNDLLAAVSEGVLPPDIGVMLISSIKSALDVEVNTDLKERIAKLEEMLNNG